MRAVMPGRRARRLPGLYGPELREGSPPSVQSDIYALALCWRRCSVAGFRGHMRKRRPIFNSGPYHEFFEELVSGTGRSIRICMRGCRRPRAIDADQQRSITFDIEGTLVTNYGERHPRPGLHDFMDFIMNNFDRIFIYTLLTAGQTREVFDTPEDRRRARWFY